MDPNETLAQLRQAYSDWEDDNGNVDAGNRMRDAAWALDEWLSRGGFTPRDWQVNRCGSPLGGDRHAMTLWGPADS